jgi:hypothetical protein
MDSCNRIEERRPVIVNVLFMIFLNSEFLVNLLNPLVVSGPVKIMPSASELYTLPTETAAYFES